MDGTDFTLTYAHGEHMLKDSRGVLCGTMATWDGYVDFQPVLVGQEPARVSKRR